MLYYSPSTGAFYDDKIHGPRIISVVDDAAQAAALKALSDAEEPLLEGPEGEHEDDRMARQVELSMIDADRSVALGNPIQMMVSNPDCRVPQDAVEISAEHRDALMHNQARGFVIVWDDEVKAPVARHRPVDREALIAGVKKERDRLLRQSDWTQMPDNELTKTDRKIWADWRQKLRNAARDFEADPFVDLAEARDQFPLPPVFFDAEGAA